MDTFTCFLGTLLLFAVQSNAVDPTVKIIPEKSHYYLMEHDVLQLDCIYEYSNGPGETLDFYHNEVLVKEIDGKFEVQITKNIQNPSTGLTTTTMTLRQNSTDLTTSKGKYDCRIGTGQSSTINIHIFTVEGSNDTVVKDAPKATLGCKLDNLDPDLEVVMTWIHNNETLVDGDKYKIHHVNGSLDIMNPVRDDMGMYFCTLEFAPNSDRDRFIVTPREVILKAGPMIDSHDNNKNMVQGDELELKCEVTGYPFPTVKWTKDGMQLNKTIRIHFMEYKGAPTGKVQIFSLDFDDQATYACMAESEVAPHNATAEMRVRVKDKLAALWPFLGIVAEVVILCVIILVYEKRRSKKLSDEDDAADNNVDNTVDQNRDVRHRRN